PGPAHRGRRGGACRLGRRRGRSARPARGRRLPPAGLRPPADDHALPPRAALAAGSQALVMLRWSWVALLTGLVAAALLLAWADSTLFRPVFPQPFEPPRRPTGLRPPAPPDLALGLA